MEEQTNKLIIENGTEYFRAYPQIFLKLNSLFKGAGFEEIKINNGLGEDEYFDKLTLMISPNPRRSRHDGRWSIDRSARDKWGGLEGWGGGGAIRVVSNYDEGEGIKEIFIDEQLIGSYHPQRNLAILNIDVQNHSLSLGLKNKFLMYIFTSFIEKLKEFGLEKKDLGDYMQERLLNKFLEQTKRNEETLASNLRDRENYLKDAQEKEIRYRRDIVQLEEDLKLVKGNQKMLKENIFERIEEVKKLPFVKKVSLNNRGIRIDFRYIALQYEGEDVELGDCHVYLTPDNIVIKNKQSVEYNGETYHSPHINEGSVCFGDGKDKAYQLLANMKLKELAYFIYLYLKTYNEEDTYLSLRRWKEAKDNGGVGSDSDDEYLDGEDD